MLAEGIITALVTPFDAEDHLDLAAAGRLVNHLIKHRVQGIFILGTNGEFHLLTYTEKIQFTKFIVEEVGGRVPVYVGTGGNSTSEVIQLCQEAEKNGADAVSIITPYFLPPTQEELVAHYSLIADSTAIPIILYNIPKNTGINISEKTVEILAKKPNIIGIKDSSGDLKNIENYLKAAEGQNFSVLSGSDSLILKALKIGAKGAIAATSNVLTDIDVGIYENWLQGNEAAAQVCQDQIEPFRKILKLGSVPSVLKKALEIEGLSVGKPRLPVRAVDAKEENEIRKVMTAYQLV